MREYVQMLVFFIALVIIIPVSSALNGLYVCHRIENYTVTTKETYVEPVKIHTLRWCLKVPPRCTQTRTELRERLRTKTEVRFRTVPVCCEGYGIQESDSGVASADAKCVPHCEKCYNGLCTAPNVCTCEVGYHGIDCSEKCKTGTWGLDCQEKCNCNPPNLCNHINGKCECPPGYMGENCDELCPASTWGVLSGCRPFCKCKNSQLKCHPETGECLDGEITSDIYEASGVSANLLPSTTSKTKDHEEKVEVIDFDNESNVPKATDKSDDLETIAVFQTNPESRTTLANTQSIKTTEAKTIDRIETGQSTTIVYDSSELPSIDNNQLTGPIDKMSSTESPSDSDSQSDNFQVIASPKVEYAKKIEGDPAVSVTTMPVNVVIVLAIGAILCISLTAIAAFMIFDVRGRLLKVAMSIYNQEKIDGQFAMSGRTNESQGAVPTGNLLGNTLPRPTRPNSLFIPNSKPNSAILDFVDTSNEYANGTVTIGIKLSSNLRDLLESQYDKPASFSYRDSFQAPDAEHVYAEIPHTSNYQFGREK